MADQQIKIRGEIRMTTNLERANRISIVGNDEGYVAKFWRTHKEIATVDSTQIGWTPQIEGLNKTAQRELFRIWICENAGKFGIEWDPADKRSSGNKFPSKYDSDELLMSTATNAIKDDVREWVEKISVACDRNLGVKEIMADDIVPVTSRNGRDVASKYMNGNWAYADIPLVVTVIDDVDNVEGYVTMVAHLVSGQFKKPDMTYTAFTEELAKDLPQIIPVKKEKEKVEKSEEVQEEVQEESKPKKKAGRPRKKKVDADTDAE